MAGHDRCYSARAFLPQATNLPVWSEMKQDVVKDEGSVHLEIAAFRRVGPLRYHDGLSRRILFLLPRHLGECVSASYFYSSLSTRHPPSGHSGRESHSFNALPSPTSTTPKT